MDWISERLADRLDVRRLLPGAQTVVSLACNYYVDTPQTESSPVARYARGRDYHYTLKDRLRALRRRLRERHPSLESYGCVDDGPFMEKVWAVRGGLGYVGRNGCLITPKFGSYVLLATLVLDARVDGYAQGPTPDLCDRCSLCISACPTDALNGARQVDARKCLSYQSIENPEPVPEPLRPGFVNLVFGCDICQEVCPLNDGPVPTLSDRFFPRAVAGLDVMGIAALKREEYQTLTQGTPLARAKYEGLRRNALYALGAARVEKARPLLEEASREQNPVLSEAARWALQQLDS